MNSKKLEISLLVSDRTGLMSSIMFLGKDLGLMYQKCQLEKINDNRSRMHVTFNGHINCTKAELINSMESHPHIYSVEEISDEYFESEVAHTSADSVSSDAVIPSNHQPNLLPHAVITPESLQVAEDALIDVLGPIAPIVVKSAASETKHIGDLFVLLSKDLEGLERKNFLSLVSGLKID